MSDQAEQALKVAAHAQVVVEHLSPRLSDDPQALELLTGLRDLVVMLAGNLAAESLADELQAAAHDRRRTAIRTLSEARRNGARL